MKLRSLVPATLASLSTIVMVHAQSIWTGAASNDWSDATNWTLGVPASGADVIIADTTTTNAIVLDADRMIGNLAYGDAGTRENPLFTINTDVNTLTIAGGLEAAGNLAGGVQLSLNGNTTISGHQTWDIGGEPGLTTADRGVRLQQSGSENTVLLNGNLTKTGSGQLLLAFVDLSGPGNLLVNEGPLKINAGSGNVISVAGPGNIQVNHNASLFFSRNTGTFDVTRPIVMNDTSLMDLGGGGTPSANIESPVAWNGFHDLVTSTFSPIPWNFTGAWSGAGEITRRDGNSTVVIAGDASSFTGSLVNQSGATRISGAFGGDLVVVGGSVELDSPAFTGNLGFTNGRLRLMRDFTGSFDFSQGAVTLDPGATLTGDALANFGASSLFLLGDVSGNVLVDEGIAAAIGGITIGGNLTTGFESSSTIAIQQGNGPAVVSGTLTVKGSLNLAIDGSVPSGQPILTFGSLVTDTPGNPLAHISVSAPSSFTDVSLAIVGNTLVANYTPGPLPLAWDTSPEFGTQGGSGEWNTTAAGWTASSGFSNIVWDNTTNAGDTALFSVGTGRVTIEENINLAGITTTTTNSSTIGGRPSMSYVLQGEGDLVFGAQQGVIDTLASGLLGFQINNRLIGTGGLLVNAADAPQSGQGWIYLSGDNSGLSGGITVQNGMIGAVEPNSLGSNAIALQGNAGLLGPINSAGPAGAVIEPPDTTLSLDNAIAVSSADNLLRVWGGRTIELTGAITGDGGLIKADGGTLILANENTGFSGDLLITGTGFTRATADQAFGTGAVELNLASGGTTRIELSGSSIGNNIILDSAAQTGFRGALTAIDGTVSTVNGDITVLRNTGNGGHLAADGDSTLVLNGTLDVGGEQTVISHRIGTVVYGGGGSTEFTFNVGEGTVRLGADNGISTAARLQMAGSGNTTLDLNGYEQTFTRLTHGATNATRTLTFTGAGKLTIHADSDTEFGPGGTLSAARNFTADMSGLDAFEWNGEDHTFRVGLRSGTGNSNTDGGGNTGTHTTLLAGNNTITASLLAVGDVPANRHGGNAFLRLGETNTLSADIINVGTSNRSNATFNFRDGLADPSVTIRGTDGTSAVNTWDVGRVANFNGNIWTATVDFSAGEVDARVNTLRIAIANPGTANTRQGIQNSSFSMGRGVLEATTVIVGEHSGNTGSSAGTYAANGIFTLDHADGVVTAGDVILANNIGTVSGGTRHVTGTFNLNDGTLEAATISRGEQSGSATNVTSNFNISGGTVRSLAESDLLISDIPVNLQSGGTATFEATAGRSITVAANAPIGGTGNLVKTGTGVMTIESSAAHLGDTSVLAGTLSLAAATLDDAGAVRISTGATLNLVHGEADTVAQLWVNGEPQPAGVYDANNTSFITGGGSLVVTTTPPVGTPFEAWLAASGLTPGDPGTGPLESADGSGVANLVQFALGGDPTDPANTGTSIVFDAGDGVTGAPFVLTIAVREGAEFAGSPSPAASHDGITYTIQGTADLADWSAAVEQVTPVFDANGTLSAPAGYELRSFRLAAPLPAGGKGFVRIAVDESP